MQGLPPGPVFHPPPPPVAMPMPPPCPYGGWGPKGDWPLSLPGWPGPRGNPCCCRLGSVLGAALDTWTETPLTMWSSPHSDWATWGQG